MLVTANKIRDGLRKTLVDIMQTPSVIPGQPKETYDETTLIYAAELALDIEDTMYELLKDSKQYADKARSIIFNLKDPKNPKLRTRILNGFMTPVEVVTADAKQLASDEQQKKIEQMLADKMAERRTDYQLEILQKNANNNGFFACRKCKKRNTTYYQQ